MSNISTLFENLMTYNDVNKSELKKVVNENDTTLLNLTVEIPENTEEITPEDVKVNVGVMNVFQDEENAKNEDEITVEDENETETEESNDVTPEDESKEEKSDDEEDDSKEEALNLRKEAIRKKRLEAKALKDCKDNCDKTDSIKTEGLFKSAQDIRDIYEKEARLFSSKVGQSACAIWTMPPNKLSDDEFEKMKNNLEQVGYKPISDNKFTKKVNGVSVAVSIYKYNGGYVYLFSYPNKAYANDDEWLAQFKTQSIKEEATDVETAKANIRKRVAANESIFKSKDKDNVRVKDLKVGTKLYMEIPGDSKKSIKTVKELPGDGGIIFTDGTHAEFKPNDYVTLYKESLMHLDTKSLNKLFTEFVKENYKNIDKVVITKAMLENRMLKIEGIITNVDGESTNISLANRGFNPIKLENKRFIMDFKDISNTFDVVKESLKQPFVFTCTLKEGILTFEELNYSYKTMIESKVAEVSGKCTLTESVKIKNENADQVKKFNEIVEKIKSAKNANDLIACKDELDDANIGDTLLSAAQMVWDDVNSRMVNK